MDRFLQVELSSYHRHHNSNLRIVIPYYFDFDSEPQTMLATKSNTYTFQKRGVWYFSRRVPADLRRHYRTGRIANLICTAILFLLGLSVPAKANPVADAQRLLNQLGYNAGPVDGLFGGKTQYAIEEFYLLKGDTFDGKLITNEIMDLSLAAEIIMPGCSAHDSPTLTKKNVFFEVLLNKIES
ncbi:peptidoglycan-binding protein [Rhodobacteraceae bacterium]|nr:peptidoglycan-binding protein [Paracoccaceae bacterium]